MAPLRVPAEAMAAALLALLAADTPARAEAAPPASLSAGAGALFSVLDRDGDGKATWPEVEASGCCDPWPTRLLFEAADSDGDGAVVPGEFHAAARALQRRQAEEALLGGEDGTAWEDGALQQAHEAWEEALLRRGQSLAALRATASAEGNATEAAPSTTTLDDAVGDKIIWQPSTRCEKYTMRSCSEVQDCLENSNSTCSDDGDCVCPDGMCASTWIGHCVPCEQQKTKVRLGMENTKCVHVPELVDYSWAVDGAGKDGGERSGP